jgi:hypothetical protein
LNKVDFLEIPKEFLSSAVLIDDDLRFPGTVEINEDVADELVVPDLNDDFGTVLEGHEPTAAEAQKSQIDPELVVDGFSDLGLICSTYHWKSGHSEAPKSTEKADLIIVDWKLKDSGENAVKILTDRLEKDMSGRNRLRYIAIYTDQPSTKVITTVAEKLSAIGGVEAKAEGDAVNVQLSHGASVWRIKHIPKKTVEEKDLATRILEDFAEFQDGILPRMVMAAIAEVRNHTYEHLFRFNRSLDDALSAHLLAKRSSKMEFPSSQESFADYTANLVLEDLAASLFSSQLVASVTSKQEVDRCLKLGTSRELKLLEGEDTNPRSFEPAELKKIFSCQEYSQLRKAVKDGFGLESPQARKFERAELPVAFGNVTDQDLAKIGNLDKVSSYPKEIELRHQLKSGTIVKKLNPETDEPQYFLCVQPICDAVRLKRSTAFPLLKLRKVELTDNFRFPISEGNDYFGLTTSYKLSTVNMVEFAPDDQTLDVRTQKTPQANSPKVFKCVTGQEYIWIAELKPHYAAEAQAALASQGGRIGNDKFEWLRRKAT